MPDATPPRPDVPAPQVAPLPDPPQGLQAGKAGGFVGSKARRLFLFVLAAVGIAIVVCLLALHLDGWPRVLFPAVALVGGLAVLSLAGKGGPLDPVPWFLGADGEREVGQILSPLAAMGYTVINDFDTGSGNVDHIVIGLTGVFAIETKNWKGRIYPKQGRLMHDGSNADGVVRQATREAMEVKKRLASAGLATWVEAVVVSTRASVTPPVLRFDRVTVMDAQRLLAHIQAGRHWMNGAEIQTASSALTRDLTG